MRIIRRACIRGTARCSQLRVLDGWIYLKLELLRYPSSLDFPDHAFFLPSIFSNLELIIFFFSKYRSLSIPGERSRSIERTVYLPSWHPREMRFRPFYAA